MADPMPPGLRPREAARRAYVEAFAASEGTKNAISSRVNAACDAFLSALAGAPEDATRREVVDKLVATEWEWGPISPSSGMRADIARTVAAAAPLLRAPLVARLALAQLALDTAHNHLKYGDPLDLAVFERGCRAADGGADHAES